MQKIFLSFLLASTTQAFAGTLTHQYTNISEEACLPAPDDDSGENFICRGISNIMLNMTFGDSTRMEIQYKGSHMDTWKYFVVNGALPAKVGGPNRVVEWVYEKNATSLPAPVALITRVDGYDPTTEKMASQLLVFGFRGDDVCFLGYRSTNEAASALAESFPQRPCSEPLPKERSDSSGLRNPASVGQRSYPDEGPIEARSVNATINRLSIASFKKVNNGDTSTGYFDLNVEYCGWKGMYDLKFEISGSPTMQEGVYLGGSYSTIRTIPISYQYKVQLPRNVGMVSACYLYNTTLKLKCEVQKGYQGAGCNFRLNNSQTIELEVLGEDYHRASLVLF